MKKKTAKEVYEDGYVEGYMKAVDEILEDLKKHHDSPHVNFASRLMIRVLQKKWEAKKNDRKD